MGADAIHPGVRIGHVHISVADLDRAIAFYRDGLGLGVTADGRPPGIPAAFLAAGDYHHHVGLNAFSARAARSWAAPCGACSTQALPSTARDHGATVSVYLSDPDGNGVELYNDRPRERWFDDSGRPVLKDERIPIESVLA